jgi:hypothetical protein
LEDLMLRTRTRASAFGLAILVAATAMVMVLVVPQGSVAAEKPAPSLEGTIDYVFVGHLGIFDAEGRLFVWEGTIEGDISGTLKWWFVLGGGPPNMPDDAHVGTYEARWEIWDGAGVVLLLAGESSGVTAKPPGKDGIWTGHGQVTEAYGAFADWNGRQSYETGSVLWGFPYSGTGTFRVN